MIELLVYHVFGGLKDKIALFFVVVVFVFRDRFLSIAQAVLELTL